MPGFARRRAVGALGGMVFAACAVAQASDRPATAAERWAAWAEHQRLERESPFHGLAWRNIGPVIQGGRVVDVEAIPGDPYGFYVAYASGGLWKTTNNGTTFAPVSDALPTSISGDLAVDPTNPDVVWYGTGEPNSSRSSYPGMGLFRSADGGRTWQPAGLDDVDRIARVRIDPANPNRVFVAAIGRLWTPGGARGVFRTDDGGRTWKHVLKGANDTTGASDLVLDPRDPNVVYAAMWDRLRRPWEFREGGPGTGIWKSSDGGDTWTKLTVGLPYGPNMGRVGIAIAPSRPDTLYASVDNFDPLPPDQQDEGDRPISARTLRTMTREEFLRQDPDEIETFIRASDLDDALDAKRLIAMVERNEITPADIAERLRDANAALFEADHRGLEIYRSDDAGATWRRTHAEPLRDVTFTYGFYFGEVKVMPDDPERVFALGVPVITSGDGGRTWERFEGQSVHVDHHAIWIDPANPRRIILGNDGGVDVSYDGGATWQRMDAQPVGQVYAIAVDMADPYNVYAGLQDNGTLRGSSRARPARGDDWQFIGGGDGMYIAVDPTDNRNLITGFQFGFYARSGSNAGEVRPRPAFGEPPLRFNWQTPVILSPHNPAIVYFGANRVFRSFDGGRTLKPISPDLSTARERGDTPYATVTTLSESPIRFGLLWAGTDDGNVQVTADGGVTWRNVSRGLPRAWVSRVHASAHVPERAYVSLTPYRDDRIDAFVYVTEDLGRTWRSLARGLPAEPVNVVREDPVNPDVLYVGTHKGVYVSLDRGASWASLAAGLPPVPVHDLLVHPRERELVIGTHGRSVWILDALPIQELTPAVRAKALHAFPVEDVQASRSWRSRPPRWHRGDPFDPLFLEPAWAHPESARGRFRAESPNLTVPYWAARDGEVTIRVLDGDGNPVLVARQPARRGINTWRWDLFVDRELALAAEQARVAKLPEAERANPPRAKTPYAESVRLGHRLMALPGDYRLEFEQGGERAELAFKVKEPEKRPPRGVPKPKIRGEEGFERR